MPPITELRLISPNQLLVEGRIIPCTIGRAGIAAPGAKREGDLMTPSGRFPLRACYYRPDRLPSPSASLPLIALTPEDGWCDDPTHPRYNQPIKLPFAGRHEKLWREDHVYDLVIPLGYNDGPIEPGKGSAIFLHLMREDSTGTEGCVALKRQDLLKILPRLTTQTILVVGEGVPSRAYRYGHPATILALISGAVIAFAMFGIAFFSNSKAIFPQYAAPLGAAAAVSFGLTLLVPGRWKRLAAAVTLPMILQAAMFTLMLAMEGRATADWLVLTASVAVACILGAGLARRLRR